MILSKYVSLPIVAGRPYARNTEKSKGFCVILQFATFNLAIFLQKNLQGTNKYIGTRKYLFEHKKY